MGSQAAETPKNESELDPVLCSTAVHDGYGAQAKISTCSTMVREEEDDEDHGGDDEVDGDER